MGGRLLDMSYEAPVLTWFWAPLPPLDRNHRVRRLSSSVDQLCPASWSFSSLLFLRVL